MATIPLRDATGMVVDLALVDDEDHHRLARFRWSLKGGAARRGARAGGRLRTVFMHREVVGAAFDDGLQIEHVNGVKLDNRRKNLRVRPRTAQTTVDAGRALRAHAGDGDA